MKMLDTFKLEDVDYLKIDCEGSEYGIFRTMTPETASLIDQIAIEVHIVDGESPDALLSRIRELGFDVQDRAPCWVAFNHRLSTNKETAA